MLGTFIVTLVYLPEAPILRKAAKIVTQKNRNKNSSLIP